MDGSISSPQKNITMEPFSLRGEILLRLVAAKVFERKKSPEGIDYIGFNSQFRRSADIHIRDNIAKPGVSVYVGADTDQRRQEVKGLVTEALRDLAEVDIYDTHFRSPREPKVLSSALVVTAPEISR